LKLERNRGGTELWRLGFDGYGRSYDDDDDDDDVAEVSPDEVVVCAYLLKEGFLLGCWTG